MQTFCFQCGQMINLSGGDDEIKTEGIIALNIPGIICGEYCVDELLDLFPDPPGLISVVKLSSAMAASAMTEMQFATGSEAAADFFLQLFPTNGEIIDTAAVRLHQEGKKEKAYSILKEGLKHGEDTDRVRLELAAISGMDGDPEYGLDIIRDVKPDTPRYFAVKGNLFRATDQWKEAAGCWQRAIETDPHDFIAWFNLGFYQLQIKEDFENAEIHFLKACSVFPDERRFRAYLGDALFFQGRKGEAIKEYHRALPMQGGDDQFENSLRRMIDKCTE